MCRGLTASIALLLIGMLLLLTGQSNVTAQSPTSTVTSSPAPTSQTTLPDTSPIIADRLYLHSSGLFSLPHLIGWDSTQGEEIFNGTQGTKTMRAGVTFINSNRLSVIHAFVEYLPEFSKQGMLALDKSFDKSYLNEAWRNFNGGWKETNRRLEYKRSIIDFELSFDGNTYLGRQLARFDQDWLLTLRLVTPINSPQLMERLQAAVWPSFTFYQNEALVPVDWPIIMDLDAGYVIKYPRGWQITSQEHGTTVQGTIGSVDATLTTMAEVGKKVTTDRQVRAWVQEQWPDAYILSVQREPRDLLVAFNVSYSLPDANGKPQSAITTLLNGLNGVLYSANFVTSDIGIDYLRVGKGDILDILLRLRKTFMILPHGLFSTAGSLATQATAEPTVASTPSAPPDPALFDMTTATQYQSPDAVLTILVPKGWQTSPYEDSRGTKGIILNASGGGAIFITLGISVGTPTELYSNVFNISGATSPKDALEKFKTQYTSVLQSGEVHPVTIGGFEGYGFSYTAEAPPANEALEGMLSIVQIDEQHLAVVAYQFNPSIAPKAKTTVEAMLVSLKIQVEKLAPAQPTQAVTATAAATLDVFIPEAAMNRFTAMPMGMASAPDYPVELPYLGNPKAPVKIEQVSNYACLHCREYYNSVIVRLMDKIRAGRVEYVFIPMTFTIGFDPVPGTKAAVCAMQQGKFWPMHEVLFDWQVRYESGAADPARLRQAADKLGLDLTKYDACIADRATSAYLELVNSYVGTRGVTGTPTIFVNGKLISPAPKLDDLINMLQVEVRTIPVVAR